MIFRKKGQSIVRMFYMWRAFGSICTTALLMFLTKYFFRDLVMYALIAGFCSSWVIDRVFELIFFEIHTRMKIRKLRSFVRMILEVEKNHFKKFHQEQ